MLAHVSGLDEPDCISCTVSLQRGLEPVYPIGHGGFPQKTGTISSSG